MGYDVVPGNMSVPFIWKEDLLYLMPGAIFQCDEDVDMGAAILEWVKKHKNDPETPFDRWMRTIHKTETAPEDAEHQ